MPGQRVAVPADLPVDPEGGKGLGKPLVEPEGKRRVGDVRQPVHGLVVDDEARDLVLGVGGHLDEVAETAPEEDARHVRGLALLQGLVGPHVTVVAEEDDRHRLECLVVQPHELPEAPVELLELDAPVPGLALGKCGQDREVRRLEPRPFGGRLAREGGEEREGGEPPAPGASGPLLFAWAA